ncbi:MAG: SDR family NAD(P)-dependent oxidoreductase [Chitinophagales bacterium]|nr:SDR family NAD(P)-dependent oxidoreductase [Chitinophagales bacterium]HMV13983.1 SDR family NAD(P)-dependent oxidoreductase [Chitinophagales bacterium]HMW12840.1 SDR family NAD(P)-dependent oxidoreductase [Chitinophagales bacterium]HMX59416.1 SDR family NAD(P)-dependent oxidoreductase [Chitinophagales bacterium]HMY24115.1 SDR family NAD(P)-dependent oxidoreductase [Chitinophagales bacterium]
MRNFRDKIAVITGAGSGIGQALAIELAKKGAILVLSDKNETGLADTKKRVETIGAQCHTYVVDVSDVKAVTAFCTKVLKEHEHIDLLFNNAGFALGKISFRDVKMEDFNRLMDVNVYAVVLHTKLFLETLIARPEAVIVNISSLFGLIGMPDQVPYCTTKFAVRGFTESLRAEMYDTNVQVHSVHPGGINTNIYKNAVHYKHDANEERIFQKMLERTSPESAAKTIIRGVERNNARILIGADAKLLDNIARTLPEGYTTIIQKGKKAMGF